MQEKDKKVIVLYKSKYGSTKRYAEWIAKEAGADLLEASKVKVEDLYRYDTVVFGGSLHAVGIKGVKLITDHFDKLMDKKLIVFAVGCSPGREEAIKHVEANNFTEEMRNKINFFYLRGAFNYKQLGFIDRFMMNALRGKLKKKKEEELDEDSKGLLAAFHEPIDWTDQKSILPLVACIRGQ
ncbi:Protoporphyrinogen IX oxidase, menaquinone-dependent (flavodoxin domain) [Geosporobacter subterraneus DSM 17957]|uniref:Protoporphyrinogen IX oxidase, menaquinone-dependent (Flavodoxin domain) n=1 Tax=Geosporobacter subterraneus DSM 17957 TaxID=1121919 RepID=A0A1M6N6D7_9FIRM|nr:flavodoxin domain-containing protein [Geosporobacter subterraneus]SHJ91260.1 Protoporphyrinogen IX oxidase, menaquinone-dependent (flavodoxin domain) [Geosporobacter subterraneus DSM 17957]